MSRHTLPHRGHYQSLANSIIPAKNNDPDSAVMDELRASTENDAHRRSFWRPTGRLALSSIVLFNAAWTVLLVVVTYQLSDLVSPIQYQVPSPANGINLRRAVMNSSIWLENEFKGDPDAAQSAAWNQFYPLSTIAVGAEDLNAIGKQSVQLTDGSNRYLAMLDVFHQIHCLDKIRLYIHRDYYDLREHPTMQKIHVHHCIDALRQIAMCRGDTELVTFEYVSEERFPNPRPNPDFVIERQCRNWDEIVAWSNARTASLSDAESRESWEKRTGIHHR